MAVPSSSSVTLIKHVVLSGMMSVGAFAPFRLAHRHAGLILKYHRFSEGRDPRAISREAFTGHLQYLARRYTLVSVPAMFAQVSAGIRSSRPLAAITIDDGHADAYQTAFPVLRQSGARATVFVVTGFLDGTCWLWTDQVRYVLTHTRVAAASCAIGSEIVQLRPGGVGDRLAAAARLNDRLKRVGEDQRRKALAGIAAALDVEIPRLPPDEYAAITWDQAREMKASGIEIEPHSVTHPILTNVPADRLYREVAESKARVEEQLGGTATAFCYPSGRWNPAVRDAVERAGYGCAVTTEEGFVAGAVDPYTLKRFGADEALARLAGTTSGFEHWQHGLRHASARVVGSLLT